MFVKFAQMGEVPEEHQELFEYFRVHYKNSNKGIKGRGKARTVAPKAKTEMAVTAPMAFAHLPMASQPQAYMAGPPPAMASMPRHAPAGGYSMFEAHHQEHGGAASMLYDDEQSRQMAFSDRLY